MPRGLYTISLFMAGNEQGIQTAINTTSVYSVNATLPYAPMYVYTATVDTSAFRSDRYNTWQD